MRALSFYSVMVAVLFVAGFLVYTTADAAVTGGGYIKKSTLSPDAMQSSIRVRDSSGVRPAKFGAGGVAPVTQEVVVSSSPISNEQYDTLLECTYDANGNNLPIACPNVVGVYPTGVTVNCPAQCKVVRKETEGPTYQGIKTYQSTKSAVCPVDYAQVAVYKSGPELAMGTVTVTPISLAEKQVLSKALWKCEPDKTKYPNGQYTNICRDGSGTTRNFPGDISVTPYEEEPGTQSPDYNKVILGKGYAESNFFTTYKLLPSGSKVAYIHYFDYACYYSLGCATEINCSRGDQKAKSYRYYVWPVLCTSPSMLHETGKQVPTAIVCARVYTAFKGPGSTSSAAPCNLRDPRQCPQP